MLPVTNGYRTATRMKAESIGYDQVTQGAEARHMAI